MKLIIAIIRPEKLTDVKQALTAAGVAKMTVTNAIGCGQQGGYPEAYRGIKTEVNLIKKVRLEIAVNDNFVDITINTILESAFTGNIGDGKIFVLPIERCIRVRTKEEGPVAIG
ncbi:MAG TPA: P-II family nitrogen regulator [Spirochaetota bacterium]|nr:P-II family nitrogen regulator [Spirochaetota bacterium]HOM39259.1 P-II family nitrogen regulator [Spirochaetota bacterium]HPQ49260.1 P-II family nitrogen regulator [Spirochaetota bacterium]